METRRIEWDRAGRRIRWNTRKRMDRNRERRREAGETARISCHGASYEHERTLRRQWRKDETREKQIVGRPYGYGTWRTSDLRMTRLYLPRLPPLPLSLSLFSPPIALSPRVCWDTVVAADESRRRRKVETGDFGEAGEPFAAREATVVIKLWSHLRQ